MELIIARLSSQGLLQQRHDISDLLQLVDVLVSAGGAQRAHHPHDELGQLTDVQRPVLSLLLDQREIQNLLDLGAQATVARQQEGQQHLDEPWRRNRETNMC